MNRHFSEIYRYAMRLLQRVPIDSPITLPITVYAEKCRQPKAYYAFLCHNHKEVEPFLDSFGFHSLLLGAPGAGKSFALKAHVRRGATSLLDRIASEFATEPRRFVVPIYLDLKRYSGSLKRMLATEISDPLLETLISDGQASFLIDSFNEAPRHFAESGALRNDLQRWVNQTQECRWIIASRDLGGLDFFGGEHFTIGDLEQAFVEDLLSEHDVDLGQRHAHDLLQLLRKPFFLSALIAGRLQLRPGGTHPAEAIETLISDHANAVRTKLGVPFDLPALCGDLAEKAIETGREIFKIADVCEAFSSDPMLGKFARKIVDTLIQSQLLLADGRGKVSFYHQSITEMIAAKHVSGRIAVDSAWVDHLLRSRHWDDCLPLILHYLDRDSTTALFGRVLAADPKLAVRCVRASEFDRAALASCVLDYLLDLPEPERAYDWPFLLALKKLPVDTIHESRLRRLLRYPAGKGGLAARLLVNAIGAAAMAPILDAVFARPKDHSLADEAGTALAEHMTCDLIKPVLERVAACDLSEMKRSQESGAVKFVEGAFKNLPADRVRAALTDRLVESKVVRQAISSWAHELSDPVSLALLVEWVANEDAVPVFAIYMRCRYHNALPQLQEFFDTELWVRFLRGVCIALADKDNGRWAAEFVQWISHNDTSSTTNLVGHIAKLPPVLQVVMRVRLFPDSEEIWPALEELFADSSRRFDEVEYALMPVLADLPWEEREVLFLKLLRHCDSKLTEALLADPLKMPFIPLTWNDLESLLPWYGEATAENSVLRSRFAWFVTRNVDQETRRRLIDTVIDKNSHYRAVIADCILPALAYESPLALPDAAVCYLIERLEHVDLTKGETSALEGAASREQVEQYLLPRFTNATGTLRKNLDQVIEKAGRRLGVRF